MRSPLLLCLLFLPLPSTQARASDGSPLLSGYVTALNPAGVDVEGWHVHLASPAGQQQPGSPPPDLHLGQHVDVYGTFNKSQKVVDATRLVPVSHKPTPVSGTAIIDLVPAPSSPSPDVQIVRADGYLLRITSKTDLRLTPPLTRPLTTNQWIHYKGTLELDGTVTIAEAEVVANHVQKTEDHMRTKAEYDPAAVAPDAHQGTFSKTFGGIDVRKMPPYQDDAMLARVQRIGQSLIPAFQLALPESDPTRIHFRFQVIDTTRFRDGFDLPNGIILIPHQAVERLDNDSQLAAVLAADIAETLEKDTLRRLPATHKMTAAQLAGNAAGFVVPGFGLATLAATYEVDKHLDALRNQQTARVSLCLLHDAGYDLREAPLAWWHLAPKHPQPREHTPLPPRAADVYQALGNLWAGRPLVSPPLAPLPATSSLP